eukprot:gene29331-35407_t
MSSGAYKAVKGKLKFKGDSKSISTVKKSSTSEIKRTSSSSDAAAPKEFEVSVQNGTGRITSSGTTIHGHGTDFMAQLSNGDAIIITHPTTLQEETKIVRMVLSNVSIGISSAFSTDLISTTPFRYIKAPKDELSQEEQARKEVQRQHQAEQQAFGTYASAGGTQFNYRVKKDGAYGGYKIISESTNSEMTREELLQMRAKKKSDRHCY